MNSPVCMMCYLSLEECACDPVVRDSAHAKASVYERLYRAQCQEHQKTHQRLREAELVISNLRGELKEQSKATKNLREFIEKTHKETKGILGYV